MHKPQSNQVCIHHYPRVLTANKNHSFLSTQNPLKPLIITTNNQNSPPVKAQKLIKTQGVLNKQRQIQIGLNQWNSVLFLLQVSDRNSNSHIIKKFRVVRTIRSNDSYKMQFRTQTLVLTTLYRFNLPSKMWWSKASLIKLLRKLICHKNKFKTERN